MQNIDLSLPLALSLFILRLDQSLRILSVGIQRYSRVKSRVIFITATRHSSLT